MPTLAIPLPTLPVTPPQPLGAVRAGVDAIVAGGPDNWRMFLEAIGQVAVSLVIAGLILAFTLWVSGLAARLTRRAVGRLQRNGAPDATLQGFMASLVRWIVIIVGLMAVLEQLGVRTTSILAVLGAASIAIGLALQGALSNVAAGVMILILRPYRVGDTVEVNGKIGTVKRLDLFMTALADPDNLDIYMPNGKVFGDTIINYSSPAYRRMELNFSVDYEHDLDRARAVLLGCATADARLLKTPAPWCQVTALGEHAVTVTLRAWAKLDVYWDARFDLVQRTSEALQAGGLEHPYPHQTALTKTPKQPTTGPDRA
ncbi:MAG TPA: mechanosensitive ion channel domain-containing protein [Caulobacteraceae bacterium]